MAVDGKFHRKSEDTNVALVLISLDHRLQTWSVEPIDVDVQTVGVNAIFGYVTE